MTVNKTLASSKTSRLIQGAGVGLRTPHLTTILEQQEPIPVWFELLADNWLATGGLDRAYLEAICEVYPVTLHGVGLSLGSVEPLDLSYLKKIKQLKTTTNACWYSEHACYSHAGDTYSHDLLPLPFTEEAANHLVQRIKQTQDYLEDQILIENVSSYLAFSESQFSEGDFLKHVAEEADCLLLLDINNFYVSQCNHGIDALAEIKKLPTKRIREIHLAGFEDKEKYVLDAHNNPVSDPVWQLYDDCLTFLGPIPTLIEWDNDIPDFNVLMCEQKQAQNKLARMKDIQKTSTRHPQTNIAIDRAIDNEVSYEIG